MARRRRKADPNGYFRRVVALNPNMLVPLYLIACAAYYVDDDPLVSDACFDWMTGELLKKWDTVHHHHKDRITIEDLRAGTGYAIKYPGIVLGSLKELRKQVSNGTLK